MLDKNNYQNNIKQFRVREGLTQEELAKKINISRQMIGLIENNKTIPSVEIALKLSKVLKESIENLFLFFWKGFTICCFNDIMSLKQTKKKEIAYVGFTCFNWFCDRTYVKPIMCKESSSSLFVIDKSWKLLEVNNIRESAPVFNVCHTSCLFKS